MHHDVREHVAERRQGTNVLKCAHWKPKGPTSPLPKGGERAQLPWKTRSLSTAHAFDSPEGSLGKSLGGSVRRGRGLYCLESSAPSWILPFAIGRLGFPLIVFNAHAITVEHESLHFLLVAPPSYPLPSTHTWTSPESFQKLSTKPRSLVVRAVSWVGSAVPFEGQGVVGGGGDTDLQIHPVFGEDYVHSTASVKCCPWTSIAGIPGRLVRSAPLQNHQIRICILKGPQVIRVSARVWEVLPYSTLGLKIPLTLASAHSWDVAESLKKKKPRNSHTTVEWIHRFIELIHQENCRMLKLLYKRMKETAVYIVNARQFDEVR